MPRFKEQAICIRHLDWSETSQVVVLLTEGKGKLRGLAKGSKRMSPSSMQRFSGGIELLTVGQVLGVTRRATELATITEWDLQDDLHHLRRSLPAQEFGLYAADLCNAMLADEDAHPRTFAALMRLLRDLAEAPQRGAALLRFQWDLLEDCGYRPELQRDAKTGLALPNQKAYHFDPLSGGLVASGGVTDWQVRRATVDLLLSLQGEAAIPAGDPASIDRANRLLCSYLRAILDRELPTMRLVLNGRR